MMTIIWIWIKGHLRLVGLLLGVAGAGLFGIIVKYVLRVPDMPAPPMPDLKNEFRAIGAEAQVQKLQAELGAEKAREHIDATYAEQLAALSSDQKARAAELENNPPALAAFLVRSSKPS